MTIIFPPPGLTLNDYKTRLFALGVDASLASAITAAINSARDDVFAHRRWSFLEQRATPLVLTAGTNSVSLTALEDLLYVDAVRLEDTGFTFEPDYVEPAFLEKQPEVTGPPEIWSLYAGEIRFWPTADKSYGVQLDFTVTPPPLVEDSDACVIPRAYGNVVVWGAAAIIAMRQRDTAFVSYANLQCEKRILQMSRTQGLVQRQSSRQVAHVPSRLDRTNAGAWPVWVG